MRHFKTISEFHEFRGLPKPNHPLFSVIDISTPMQLYFDEPMTMSKDFYGIGVKRMHNVKIKYGQESFDFNEGILTFMAPQQVFSIDIEDKTREVKRSGWVIYIHPDFLWNTPLAKTIRHYDFWDYTLKEALFLSAKEEAVINNIIANILQEYNSNIDKFSKKIIITHIESLLNYAERFYDRQFITREKANHKILDRLEKALNDYLSSGQPATKGLPSVNGVAAMLHISPKYLSSLLRVHTGQNTQHYIHEKLIERAKERIATSELTISEIAYELGFEHFQSFSRLFKAKTRLSPLEFRQLFKN